MTKATVERYYLKVKGMQGSIVAHDTLAEANAEAARLLSKLGKRVYVLKVVGVLDPPIGPNTITLAKQKKGG